MFTFQLQIPSISDISSNSNFMEETTNSLFHAIYSFLNQLDLLFLLMAMGGLLFLVASSSVKQGQWKKAGYGLLIGSYGSLLLIKGLPLLFSQVSQVSILTEAIKIASYLLLLWSTINLCMSYSYRMGHSLIGHVDFLRLSKNTALNSLIVIACVVIISFINY